MQDEESKVKRVPAETGKILQFRKNVDAFIAELGPEAEADADRRNRTLAYIAGLTKPDREFLMFDLILELLNWQGQVSEILEKVGHFFNGMERGVEQATKEFQEEKQYLENVESERKDPSYL